MSQIDGENKVARNIRYWRKKNKLTQKELADLIGVSEITLNRYENGNRSPKYDKALKLAKVFNISFDWFVEACHSHAECVYVVFLTVNHERNEIDKIFRSNDDAQKYLKLVHKLIESEDAKYRQYDGAYIDKRLLE